jgi:hypothetical protein
MATRIFFIVLLLMAILCPVTAAYAQNEMRNSTSGNRVDVLVEPAWSDGGQARFTVSFLRNGTDALQEHVDYTFAIMKDGEEIFNAIPPGQPFLHTVEGVVNIPESPYPFPSNGDYSIVISVHSINFVPIAAETSTFSVTVTPEFPAPGILAVTLAALMSTSIVLARKRILS